MVSLIHREVIENYSILGSERAVLEELFEYFNKYVPERLASAKGAAVEKDFKKLRYLLHSLKNSFLNVGALGVGEECQEFEDNLGSLEPGEMLNKIEFLNERYKTVQLEVSDIIKNEL